MNKSIYFCWYCGDYTTADNDRHDRVYCEGCAEKYKEERKELINKYVGMKLEVMWQRAVNNLEKQNLRMNEYYDEAMYVRELAMEDLNRFQSSAEMMVAMELLKNRVKAKTQYKIKNYRVDFFIPDLKVVLEVDGKLHDFKVKKDSNRDVIILNELNKEDKGWEVIRIPVKHIERDVSKLMLAIKTLYAEKQRLRRKNGGFLPAYFSKREVQSQLNAVKSLGKNESKRYLEDLEQGWEPKEL